MFVLKSIGYQKKKNNETSLMEVFRHITILEIIDNVVSFSYSIKIAEDVTPEQAMNKLADIVKVSREQKTLAFNGSTLEHEEVSVQGESLKKEVHASNRAFGLHLILSGLPAKINRGK